MASKVRLLNGKVIVEKLPEGGQDESLERVVSPQRSPKGEMVQIVNKKGAGKGFKHIVYCELKRGKGKTRGSHLHQRKTEFVYVVSGKVKLWVRDEELSKQETHVLDRGDKVTIKPKVCHTYEGLAISSFLEYSYGSYDSSDTCSCHVLTDRFSGLKK